MFSKEIREIMGDMVSASERRSEFALRLRAFEARCAEAMPSLKCSVHLCKGQEIVPEILFENLLPDDWLFSTHRNHGHYLAKGGSEEKLWDEIQGLPSGVNGGFSGSQSFCDTRIKFHATAIVGGLIGVATGTALGLKLDGSPHRVVCCLGDAATEQGIFWESANFAALHRLPILFVCENNRLSVHAPIKARQASPIALRAYAFGLRVYRGPKGLRRAFKEGKLPAFVEVAVHRDCNHVSAMEDLRE